MLLWRIILSFVLVSLSALFPVWVFIYIFLTAAGLATLSVYLLGFSMKNRRSGGARMAAQPRSSKIAVVMPICNEEPRAVYEAASRTWLSIRQAGFDGHCDFYFLSDTVDSELRRAEEVMHARFRSQFDCAEGWIAGDFGKNFFVHRAERANLKAGNIAHFLDRHGENYDFMLVLDADSIMSGQTIRRMIQRMEANPNLAILQAPIVPHGSITPFARAMQYSFGRTMPLFARGFSRLMGRCSIYWGHNALIRIKPFMEHANLPILPGKPPLGGPIMSQDIVEAALLGRAGWKVAWEEDCRGSWDELPANILSYAKRDRRWCQGNLQHFWLIFGDGFKLKHRLYFAYGILTYFTGPLILSLALAGFCQAARNAQFTTRFIFDARFLLLTFVVVALPRVFGLARALANRKQIHDPTGANRPGKEILSTLLEFGICILTAPLLIYLHTRFVLEILTGQMIEWKSQSRKCDEGISWSDAARVFWPPTLLGSIWWWIGCWVAPGFLFYVVPILLGWVLSIPIAVTISSPRLGRFLIAKGFLGEWLSFDEREVFSITPLGKLAESKVAGRLTSAGAAKWLRRSTVQDPRSASERDRVKNGMLCAPPPSASEPRTF